MKAWFDGTWEHGVPRLTKGVSNRVDKLKSLGNAVVPQWAFPIFKAIAEIEWGGQTSPSPPEGSKNVHCQM